jgi:hypothetical protein
MQRDHVSAWIVLTEPFQVRFASEDHRHWVVHSYVLCVKVGGVKLRSGNVLASALRVSRNDTVARLAAIFRDPRSGRSRTGQFESCFDRGLNRHVQLSRRLAHRRPSS